MNKRETTSPPVKDKFMSGTREELDLQFEVMEGGLPTDIYGYVYINSAVGSVNSGGLPYPELTPDGMPNPEFGSPIFNGDGYVIRIGFNEQGKVSLRTRIMKTPSYYADLALREGGPASKKKRFKGDLWKFKNVGLGRMSFQLGQCNPANVGVVPVKFTEEEPIRLVATYDAGRPWEFDPESMDVKAPIIRNDDTVAVMPEWLRRYPFKGILGTAHPVYDGKTKEFFFANFIKSVSTLIGFQRILLSTFQSPKKTRKKVLDVIESSKNIGGEEGLREFIRFVEEDSYELEGKKSPQFRDAFANLTDKVIPSDGVFLIRWQGHPDVHKWRIRCEGKDITILDTMHQMGITENYIILQDSSFKLNLSQMFNLLRPEYPELDSMLRELLTQPMNPFSTLYFVKRSDLTTDRNSVEAVKAIIPLECVHFSANYEEENGHITIMTANNTATCPAEWMRHFDTLKRTGEPIDKKWLGYLNAGPMDVGRVGRFVYDPGTGALIEKDSNVLFEKGNIDDPESTSAHTWAIGLYSYRGCEEVTSRPAKINSIYWEVFGLDRENLTEFIFEMYKDYPHREVSIEEIEKISEKGIPMGIVRVDHSEEELKIKDYYQYPPDHHMRSIQFVPKNTENSSIPSDRNGYILCTVILPKSSEGEEKTYKSEVWLWDANDLAKGPLCKLHHPKFKFAYTLHSVWNPTATSTSPEVQVDVIDDIDDQVLAIGNFVRQVKIEDFMEEFVYPHFANQENAIDDWDPKDYSGKVYKWVLRNLGLRQRKMRLTKRDI